MEHIALTRLHVFQGSEPFAATLAVTFEHRKFMLVLDDVAVGGIVEVLRQSRCHRQVHQRRVANAVPSWSHTDGAVFLILVGLAPDFHAMVVLHLDLVAELLRQVFGVNFLTCVAHPLAVAIDQRQVLRILRQDVALLPWEPSEDGR